MDNQYIKPTNKHSIGYFPLRSKTTYGKQYVKRDQKKDDYTYISDQLKTGSNWYGRTTYSDFYNQPDPQYHAKKVKIVEKLDRNPDDNQQFSTFKLIQKQHIKDSSKRRKILYVLPKFTFRQKVMAFLTVPKLSSLRILTSNRSLQNTTQFPTLNIIMSDSNIYSIAHFKKSLT